MGARRGRRADFFPPPAQDIASSTNMAAAELKRTLQSLACAKYKVLTKVPKGRDVDDTDSFLYNSAFTAPLAKIKIQTVASKVESADERRETEEKVEEMRNTQCDVSSRLSCSTASPLCRSLTFPFPFSLPLLDSPGMHRPRDEG